jgi:low affinity Fe/Cu permease
MTAMDRFSRYARALSISVGRPWAFVVATVSVLVWLVTGPIFRFSDTWQLVLNTVTNIVTFLMVFVIQNTQNADTTALQLKFDELIKATNRASKEVVGIEERPESELENQKKRTERT